MCDTCPIEWPEDWPCFDLTVPDGTAVDWVMTMSLDALNLSGGP